MICGIVEIGPVVLEKQSFKICQCIFAISLLSLHWKRTNPSLENLDSHSAKDDFCQVWLKLSPLEKGQGPSFVQT